MNMVPTSFRKQVSNRCSQLHRFCNQLGSILGGFWEPSWSQVGTKSLQKSIPKVIKKTITISMASGWIFDRFWPPTCLPRGGPRIDFSRSWGLLGPPWGHLGAKMAPRPPQTPPRGLLGAILDDFGLHFGGFLNGVGPHFGRFLDGLAIASQPANQPTS